MIEWFLNFPLPALIYDAEKGVTLSRLYAFEYWLTCRERKHDPAPYADEFVTRALREALEGIANGDAKAAYQMFNPSARKISTAEARPYLEMYRSLRGSSEDRFEEMAEHNVPNPKEGTKRQKARRDRLRRVQALLDEKRRCERALDGEGALSAMQGLIAIYKDPSKLI